jgi:hypothetical protein
VLLDDGEEVRLSFPEPDLEPPDSTFRNPTG